MSNFHWFFFLGGGGARDIWNTVHFLHNVQLSGYWEWQVFNAYFFMSPCTRMWRGYSRPFITKQLGWCTKVLLLRKIVPVTTGVVTDFDVMAWMLCNTLTKSHSLSPSDFHLFGPCEKYLAGKGFGAHANMKQTVTSWLQTLDTNFLYTGLQASLPQSDKCTNITSACVEFWCVQSTADMPCIHQRLNKVLKVWEFVNSRFENHFDFNPKVKFNISCFVLLTEAVTNCTNKRHASDVTETHSASTKRRRWLQDLEVPFCRTLMLM